MNAVASVLRSSNSATDKSKGSRSELKGHEELVDKVASLKAELSVLTAKYTDAESELIKVATELYDAERERDAYATSIECKGSTSHGLLVTFSDKFSDLPLSTEKELRESCEFDTFFYESRSITVKKDLEGITVSDKTVRKLVKLLGKELFAELFDVEVKIGVRKGVARLLHKLSTAVRGMLKQSKPSVKELNAIGKV